MHADRRASWLKVGFVASTVAVSWGQPGFGEEPPDLAAHGIPPRVVSVEPAEHATAVSPDVKTMTVTFDRPMVTDGFSWLLLRPYGQYPGVRGGPAPQFDETGKKCTLSVALKPGAVYAVGINSPRHTGFKDTGGLPALQFGWAFSTGAAEEAGLPPRVVKVSPPHGAVDVKPGNRAISVTFDRPMVRGSWSWILQPGRGEYPKGGSQPEFDDAGLTCTMEVPLRADTVYAIGVNSYRHTGFKSEGGAAALPFAWAFRTAGGKSAAPAKSKAAPPTRTAVVKTKGGRTYRGKLVKQDDRAVVVKTIGGTFTLDRGEIESVTFAEAPRVAAGGGEPVDMLERYSTTLTKGDANPKQARAWKFTTKDMYALSAFSLKEGDSLSVECGPSTLGIGHSADGAVWAIVIPRGKKKLQSSAASKSETIDHIWLRFHPKQVAALFPKPTVRPGTSKRSHRRMRQIARAKMRCSWQANGKAMIPGPDEIIVDIDTKGGPRRFFGVHRDKKRVDYVAAFENRPVK